MGPASCEIVNDGCRVRIIGKTYTLYSAVRLPRKARYLKDWAVTLETDIERGAAGLALGNDHGGLIFQVRDGGVAEILSYRAGEKTDLKRTRTTKASGSEYSLGVALGVQEKHVVFSVNGDEVFALNTRDLSDLHVPSSITQVAVTTTLPEGGGREASVLHRNVRIHAE